MIFALVTFIGVIFFGGFCYYILDYTHTMVLNQYTVAYPTYFTNVYVDFISNFLPWFPFLIVIIAAVSALVIELRQRNPDAYVGF